MCCWPCSVRVWVWVDQDGAGLCLQVLLMQPNTTAVFGFQMTQAAVYYGGVGTCNFNTTVNYAVRSRRAACPKQAAHKQILPALPHHVATCISERPHPKGSVWTGAGSP